MKKALYVILVVLLLIVFAASALYLGNYFLESKQQQDRFNELSSMVEHSRIEPETSLPTEESPYGIPGEGQYYTPDIIDEPENTPERPEYVSGSDFLPWYMELHHQNPDMIGWIQIEGSKINYPVMQTTFENSNYYLYRDFDRKDSIRGSIYARETCDVFEPSDNITIFGHNMKDGTMFAYLGAYYDKAVWEQNSLIFFDTLTESHVYKIFAVFKTSPNNGNGFAYHEMENAKDAEEFNRFVATCKQLSFYDTGITPVYGDKLICLSTCEYTLDDGRFVVAAVRIT